MRTSELIMSIILSAGADHMLGGRNTRAQNTVAGMTAD